MTRRIVAGLLASTVVLALSQCGDGTGRPTRAQRCAHELGIAYSVEDGATERLDEFRACVAR